MKLLIAGSPTVVDQLGCFKCGNMTGDVNETGKRLIYCAECRELIVKDAIRREVESMEWPDEIVT